MTEGNGARQVGERHRSPQRHPLADRGDDCYETPPSALWALLGAERIPQVVWEPACGPGAIVRELRAAGRTVIASDLVDYGDDRCPDSEARVDFLMEWRAPPSVECIVTNAPNKLAVQFVAHAKRLCPLVFMLLRFNFLAAERAGFPDLYNGLRQVCVFKHRLPHMHRRGWTGRKSTSQDNHAWFKWERGYRGPIMASRIALPAAPGRDLARALP